MKFKGLERALLLLSAIATACILGVIVYFCRYGFDFTDESFYVTWLADPTAYSIHIPVSFFGFIYHPLYVLLNGNIAAIRVANVLVTFAIAYSLSFIVLKDFWTSEETPRGFLPILSAAISTLALISFGPWLVTPNYNTLAFQALMITLIGLFLLYKSNRYEVTAGWLLVGIGGWAAFMAKPTTAAALALLIPLCWFLSGGKRWYPMVLAALLAAFLVFLSALFVAGSMSAFIFRVENSIEMLRLLGSGQEFSKIFRIDQFLINPAERIPAVITIVFVLVAALSLMRQWGLMYLTSVVACLLIAVAAAGIGFSGYIPFSLQRTTIFIISGALVLGFLIFLRKSYLQHLSRRHVVLGLTLLAFPHLYAFGTNGNYWTQGSATAFFWVLAAVVLISPVAKLERGNLALVPLAVMVQSLAIVMMNYGIREPYRQPDSLRNNAASIDLRGKGELVLSTGFHDYFAEAMNVARKAAFHPGMTAIDLTGQSPGILYALGARGLGQPWMVGGYPGSDRLAMASLDTASCDDIASAWLVEEPGGPRSLTVASVLLHIGANRDTDYEVVGSFKTAAYAGGYAEPRTQNLLKPTRLKDVAATACLNARKQSDAAKENS